MAATIYVEIESGVFTGPVHQHQGYYGWRLPHLAAGRVRLRRNRRNSGPRAAAPPSLGCMPETHPDAWIAPSAVVTGDVTIGAGSRVLAGAVLTGDLGPVVIGSDVLVMEHALLRGRADHPLVVGDAVLVGPHTHLNGTTIDDEVFVATGVSMFPGSHAGRGCELRINSVLHVNSELSPETVVPIGWIAAGRPAELFSPDRTTSCGRRRSRSTSRARSTAYRAGRRCARSCAASARRSVPPSRRTAGRGVSQPSPGKWLGATPKAISRTAAASSAVIAHRRSLPAVLPTSCP